MNDEFAQLPKFFDIQPGAAGPVDFKAAPPQEVMVTPDTVPADTEFSNDTFVDGMNFETGDAGMTAPAADAPAAEGFNTPDATAPVEVSTPEQQQEAPTTESETAAIEDQITAAIDEAPAEPAPEAAPAATAEQPIDRDDASPIVPEEENADDTPQETPAEPEQQADNADLANTRAKLEAALHNLATAEETLKTQQEAVDSALYGIGQTLLDSDKKTVYDATKPVYDVGGPDALTPEAVLSPADFEAYQKQKEAGLNTYLNAVRAKLHDAVRESAAQAADHALEDAGLARAA